MVYLMIESIYVLDDLDGIMGYGLRTKIWIVDPAGNVLFGMGRVKILEAIDRGGSINAAAKELKMSYRAVWGRIKATEERLGRELVIRTTGGASGGGSSLTPYARDLIREYKAFRLQVIEDADARFERILLSKLAQ
jgi:molybdate transport system regulatory protein